MARRLHGVVLRGDPPAAGCCLARLPAHGSLAEHTGAGAILPRLFRVPYAAQVDPHQPVAALSAETSGTLARSARWRDLPRTARQHVKAVFAKVGVHDRDHLRDVLTGG